MSFSRPTSRWILIIMCLIVLVAFNLAYGRFENARQARFDAWLDQTVATLRTAEKTPKLELKLRIDEPGAAANDLTISLNEDSGSKDRIVRLLELIKEARLFALEEKDTKVEGGGSVSLLVSSDSDDFRSRFSEEEIGQNIPAQSLLKLFQIYAQEKEDPTKIQLSEKRL